MTQINIKDESGDDKMLWEKYGKPAYERGFLEGRQESGLFAVIPMSILENKNLSSNAKLLYGEIMALSKKSGKCYATNEYLGNTLGLAKLSMPQLLKELSSVGLIMVSVDRSKRGTYRDITVSFFNETGHSGLTGEGLVGQRGQKRNRQSINKQIDKDLSTLSVERNKEIGELIDLFKSVNPSYRTLFGRKVQRAAVERMLEAIGREKLEGAIKMLPKTNPMEFAPKITTPLELENKLGKLISFCQQIKESKQKNIPIIL